MPSKRPKTLRLTPVRAPATLSTSRALPDSLRNFDSLPNAAHVRQPVVEALFGCSGATIWRRVRDGRLPTPNKLSERVTAWNVGELRQALAVAMEVQQ